MNKSHIILTIKFTDISQICKRILDILFIVKIKVYILYLKIYKHLCSVDAVISQVIISQNIDDSVENIIKYNLKMWFLR